MLNTIAVGDIDRYVPGNKQLVLTDGKYEAALMLTRFGDKETWLLSGWDKIETTGDSGEVSATSTSTQNSPTFSRAELGAVISDANLRRIFIDSKKKGINLLDASVNTDGDVDTSLVGGEGESAADRIMREREARRKEIERRAEGGGANGEKITLTWNDVRNMEPDSLYDFVLRNLAQGDLKVKWNDTESGTSGLGNESVWVRFFVTYWRVLSVFLVGYASCY